MKKDDQQFPGMQEKVLLAASTAIREIEAGRGTLDEALERIPGDCRRMTEHLLISFFRYRKSLQVSWRKFCRKDPVPEISSLLDAALTQCRFQNSVVPQSVVNVAVSLSRSRHADKFVNAVLRSVLKEEYILPEKPEDILPEAVLKRWRKNFSPAETAHFAKLFLTPAPFIFRLCRGAALPEKCSEVPAHGGFRFASGEARTILDSPEFSRGEYYIQDPATSMAISLAAEVLGKSRNLLDICAAPGGKTLMASELLFPGAKITAADVSSYRQKFTAENFARHHLDARIITAEPSQITGEYDFIIADLPCSNSGVFRRRPDALWRFSGRSLAEVMKLQKRILAEIPRLLVPGGYLLISTCSIEADENGALTSGITGFELLKSQTLLPSEDSDGAFAALMRKVDN